MKQVRYRNFSWNSHAFNWQAKKPSVCQFELTFGCALHCRHCYSDCYNRRELIAKELTTKEVKAVLDKLYCLGVLWVCFTGGDPLSRKDFPEIYRYAKEKGFIVTVFSNGYSMTKEIADDLEKSPPFAIEITLNGVSRKVYESISQVAGSYDKAIRGLGLILERGLPLKVKTLICSLNYKEIPQIKEFLAKKKIQFRPDAIIQARLNGDTSPCRLRLEPEKIFSLEDKLYGNKAPKIKKSAAKEKANFDLAGRREKLFLCAIGSGDGIQLDPYGKMFACCSIRKPAINFLASSLSRIKKALYEDFRVFRQMAFKTSSVCSSCKIAHLCRICPGKKYLEIKDREAPIEYFCRLAKLTQARYSPLH